MKKCWMGKGCSPDKNKPMQLWLENSGTRGEPWAICALGEDFSLTTLAELQHCCRAHHLVPCSFLLYQPSACSALFSHYANSKVQSQEWSGGQGLKGRVWRVAQSWGSAPLWQKESRKGFISSGDAALLQEEVAYTVKCLCKTWGGCSCHMVRNAVSESNF